MTDNALVWETSETSFGEQEYAVTNFRGEVISSDIIAMERRIINSLSTGEDDAFYLMDENYFFNALDAKVNMARFGESKGRHGVTFESLSQKLLI